MDVGGGLSNGLGEECIDEPDDGRVIFLFEQVVRLRQRIGETQQIDLVIHVFDHLPGGGGITGIGFGQQPFEFPVCNHSQDEFAAGNPLDLGEHSKRRASLAGDFDLVDAQHGIGDDDAMSFCIGEGQPRQWPGFNPADGG